MQPSEIYRQGIVVPLDHESFLQLAAWEVDEKTRVHLLMLDQKDFNRLWRIGVFAELNKMCGSIIDEYEEETIEVAALARAKQVITQFAKTSPKDRLLQQLLNLCDAAIGLRFPMFFIL